ncbi:MAG: stage II sporulation protein D [Clostridia bacterium]|nr:stage II sporulation protein D [Clostridia bacterium]
MNSNLIVFMIIAVSLIICPAAALAGDFSDKNMQDVIAVQAEEAEEGEYISVMSSSTGKTEKIKLREYVIGSVAAEMPAVYHTEALKAQAVASYTYAKKIGEQNEKYKESYLGDADITDSPDTHQGYIDEKRRKEKWGEKFEEYEKKTEDAVDEVFGYFMTYNGDTALAVYHSNSAGKTQSAKTLWGTEIPYLISVESPGDKLSPDYVTTHEFSKNEFKKLAKSCDINLDGNAEEWVGELTKAESGYVVSVRLGSTEVSASKFREEFGLKSCCFDIDYSDDKFTVTCYGYGHGAGMSQYGADYMARQGCTWREILKHYYTGIEIDSE